MRKNGNIMQVEVLSPVCEGGNERKKIRSDGGKERKGNGKERKKRMDWSLKENGYLV